MDGRRSSADSIKLSPLSEWRRDNVFVNRKKSEVKPIHRSSTDFDTTLVIGPQMDTMKTSGRSRAASPGEHTRMVQAEQFELNQAIALQQQMNALESQKRMSARQSWPSRHSIKGSNAQLESDEQLPVPHQLQQQQEQQHQYYQEQQHQQQVQQQCNQQQHQQHQQQQQQQQQQEQQQHNDHKEHHHQQQQKQPVVQQQHLSYQQLPKQQQHQQQQQTRQQYRQQQQQQELQQQPQQHQHQQQWPQRQQKVNKTPEAPAWRWQQQQAQENVYQDSFEDLTEEDLFSQCQNHLHVINSCTDLQQYIKDEMKKQATLENMIFHKMTAKAQRLQQKALNLRQSRAIGWVAQALEELSGQVTQQAQAHHVYMITLANQCKAIQHSLNGHHQLMKNVLAHNSPENSAQCASMKWMKSNPQASPRHGEVMTGGETDEDRVARISFLQASHNFEGIRKPRMKLLNKIEYLHSQQRVTIHQLSEVEAAIKDLMSHEENETLIWRIQVEIKDNEIRREFLETRREQIDSDLKFAGLELKDFDYEYRDELLEILNVFRQHRVRYDTTLKKSFDLLRAIILREKGYLKSMVSKDALSAETQTHSDDEDDSEIYSSSMDNWVFKMLSSAKETAQSSETSDYTKVNATMSTGSPDNKSTNPFLNFRAEKDTTPYSRDAFYSFMSLDSTATGSSGNRIKPSNVPPEGSITRRTPSPRTVDDFVGVETFVGATNVNFSRAESSSSSSKPDYSNETDEKDMEASPVENESNVLARSLNEENALSHKSESIESPQEDDDETEKEMIRKYIKESDSSQNNILTKVKLDRMKRLHNLLKSGSQGSSDTLEDDENSFEGNCIFQVEKIEGEMHQKHREEERILHLITKYAGSNKLWKLKRCLSLSKNSNNCEPVPRHIVEAAGALEGEDRLDFDYIQILSPETHGRSVRVCAVRPISSEGENDDTPEEANNNRTSDNVKPTNEETAEGGMAIDLTVYEITAGQFMAPKENGAILEDGCESVERPATNCSNNMQPCFFGNNKKISPQRDEAQKSTSETRVKDVFEYTPAPKEKMNSRQDSSPHTNSENLRNRDDRSDVSDSERKASRCHSVKLENEGVKPFTYRDKQQELFARGQKTSGSGEANSERTNFELEDETENTLPKIIIGQSEIPNAAEVSRDKYSQESDRWGASIGHAKKDESQIGDGWEEETIPKTMYLEVDEAIAVQSLSKTIQCEHETVPKEFDPNPSSKPCELRTTTNLLPNQTWNRPLKSSLRRASWQRPTHIGIQYLEREKWSSEYGFAYQSKAMPSVYPLPYDEDLIEKQQIAANQDLRESQHQDGSKPNRCTKKVRFDHRVQFDDNTEMIDSSSSSDQVRSSSDDVDALNCNNSNDTALATAQNKENNPLYTPGSLRYIICEFLVCDFVRENINQSNNTDNNSQDDTLAQVEAKQDGNVAGQGTGQEQPSTKPVHTWHLLEHRDEQSRQPTFSEEQTDMPQGDMPQADSSQMHPVFVTSFSSRTHSGNSAKFSNIICQRKGIITAQVSNSSNKLLPQVSYDNIWPTTALPCETETRLPSINGDEKHLTATEVSHEYDLTHGKNEHLSFITPFPLKRLELETSGWTNGKPPFKNSSETRSLEGQQRVKNTQAVCAAFYQSYKPSSERSHQNSGNFQRDIGRHEVKNEPNTQRQEKPNDTKKSGKPVVLPILRNQSVGINTPRVARKTSGRTQHDSDVLLPSGCYKDRTPIPFTIKTLELTISSRSARKTTFSNSNSNSLAHQGQCSAHDDLCFRSESAGGNEVDQPASNKSADLSEISAGKQRAPDNHFAPTLSLGKRPWSTNRYLRAKGRSPTVKISEVSEHVVLPRRRRRYLPAGSVRFCSPPSTGHSQHMKRMIQPDLEQEDKRHQTQKQTSVCILDVADAAAECQTPKSHLQETPKKVRIDDGSLHPDEDGTNISVHEMTISSQYATEIQGEKSPKDPSEKRLHTDQLDCPSRSLEPEGMVADSCRQDDDAVNNVCVDTETPKQQRETSGTALYDSEPTTENLWKLRKLSKGFTTADELYASSAAQAQRAIRCYSDPRPPMMIRPVRLKTKLTPFLCGELTKEMCRKSEKITDINLMTVLRSRGVTTPRKVMPLGKSSAYAEAIRGCPSVFSYIKNAGVQEEQKEGLVPVQHDDSIVPIQCDNSTVPAHCDISIVPTLRDDSTVSAERDSSLVSAQHDNFPVSAQCDSSTVLAQCDNSTVSAQLDSSTFPAQHDHSTVSAQRDNSAVSAQHDNSTVPAQHDNSIVPEQRDNSTVSTEHDSSTVSAQRDNSTVSAQCDNSIVLAQCDSSTFSTQRNSCTVSARRDNSTVPAQHDNITKLRIQEKPLTPCDSEKVSNRDTTLICRKGRGFPPANRSKPTFGFPPACRSKDIPHKSVKSVAQKTGRKKSQSVLEQPKVLRSPRKTATEHQRKTANVCENMHEGSNKGSGKSLANGHKRLRMTSKSLPQHCNEPPATDTDTVHKHAKNSMLTEKPCPKRKIMVTNIELPRSDHPKSENKLCQKQKPNVLRSGRASQKSIENLIDPENGAAISCNAPVDERYPSKTSSSYSSEKAPTFGKDHSLGNMHKKLPLNGKKVTTANSAMTHQRPDIVGLRLAQKDAQAKSTLSRPIENEPLQSRCTLTQETFDRVRRWLDMSVTCRTTPSVPRPANVMQGGPLCTAASKIQPDGKSHMSVAQSSVVRGRDPFRSGQNADGVTPNSLGPSGLEMQPVKSNKHKSTSATTSVSFSNNRNNNVCRRSHDVCNSMQYPAPNSQPHQGKTCLPYADHHVRMSLCGSFNDPHLKIPTYFHRQEDPIPISYTNESKVIVHKSRENQRVCLNTDASINCAREVSERCTRNNLNGGHPTCYRLPADEAQRPKRHEVSSTVCRNKTPAIPNITPKNRYKRTWPSKPKNGVAIIGLQAFGYRRRRKDSDPSRQPQSDSIDQQVEVRPSNTCGDKLSSTPANCHGPSEPCQLNKQTAAHFESVMPQEESTNTFTVPCEEQRLQGESILSRASKSREGARHARSPWSLFKPQQKVAGPSDETESKQSHMPLPLRVAQSQSRTIETNNLRPDARSLYHYPQKFPVSDPAAVPHLSQRQEQEPHFREASDAAPDLVPQWFCPQEGSTPKHKTAEYLSLINSWEPSPTAP